MSRSVVTFRAPDGSVLFGLWENTSDIMCNGLTRVPMTEFAPLQNAAPCKCGGPTVRLACDHGRHVRACLEHMVITDTGFRMTSGMDFEYVDVP